MDRPCLRAARHDAPSSPPRRAVETSLSPGATDVARAREVIVSFNDILVDHLHREEVLVIPVLLEMTSTEARALIHGES